MDPLAAPIRALHSEGRLRVWSLVITVFGDALRPRGGRVATARLQKLLGRLGVAPGALRTALSRLTADGWLLREREGRVSYYRLSPRGVAEFGPASARIYAAPVAVTGWTLALGARPAGALDLGGDAWAWPGPLPAGVSAELAVTGKLSALSETGRVRLCPAELRAALEALMADLAAIAPEPADPLDAMAARVLLIHRWRRIILRWALPPAELLPAPFAGDPQRQVARTYAALLPASERWLDSAGLPAADASLTARFAQG